MPCPFSARSRASKPDVYAVDSGAWGRGPNGLGLAARKAPTYVALSRNVRVGAGARGPQPGASPKPSPSPAASPQGPGTQNVQQLVNRAIQEFQEYQRLTSEGKLAEAGKKLEEHKRTLEELKKATGKP